jgi:putative nucleotidyltransferase with HDIG domain
MPARTDPPTVTLPAADPLRPVLVAVGEALGHPVWLAGGSVRDLLLGRPLHDVDLVLPAGSLGAARRLADRLEGAYVPLGEARGMARVVVPRPPAVHIDLADFRGPTLEADLAGRDFTVDALAVDLGALLRGPAPIRDPTGGLGDLAARRLRACRPTALADDPVRVLRALRLAQQLGLAIDPGTEALARAAAPALASVAAERVRDELTHVLRLSRSAPAVRQADAWSALVVILPEVGAMRGTSQSAPHRFTVWEHSLRALEAADALLADLGLLAPHDARVAASLAEPLGGGLTRREAWKLAVLLHDVAKPETRTVEADGRTRFIGHDRLGAERVAGIAGRLRWPARAAEVLARLVRHHLRPMHLGMLDEVTGRARYRFHRDVGAEVPALVCLTIADAAGTDGRPPGLVYRGATRTLLESLLAGEAAATREAAVPPLVRGEDVMAALGLPPGPAVGRVLRRAREAQALGLVRTRDEALAWLARAGAAPGPPPGDPGDARTVACGDEASGDDD